MRILTKDGSFTLAHQVFEASYHSTHGAYTESKTVFIENGLEHILHAENQNLNILEIGFGTGLNFLLSLAHFQNHQGQITYHGIEKYPMSWDEVQQFEYLKLIEDLNSASHIYKTVIEEHGYSRLEENTNLIVELFESDFQDHDYPSEFYDLIYYDAFGPGVQPELWSEEMAIKMGKTLKTGGVLVTYCVQGQWRRHLVAAGFSCEKLPGPPGKREVLRATKLT